VLVGTISPSRGAYEETVSTLQFADRAKRVMETIQVNEVNSSVVNSSVVIGFHPLSIHTFFRSEFICSEGVPCEFFRNELYPY
jgi:hypothetical protein